MDDDLKASEVSLFWSKVDRADDDSCWIWTGVKNRRGYGLFHSGGRRHWAHRYSVELTGVAIAAGLVVDHVCRTKACVNPLHLRVVTQTQNCLENSVSPAALNARKTHCARGHPLSGDNLRIKINHDGPERVCCQCNILNIRAHRARKARAILTGSETNAR